MINVSINSRGLLIGFSGCMQDPVNSVFSGLAEADDMDTLLFIVFTALNQVCVISGGSQRNAFLLKNADVFLVMNRSDMADLKRHIKSSISLSHEIP